MAGLILLGQSRQRLIKRFDVVVCVIGSGASWAEHELTTVASERHRSGGTVS